MRANYDYYNHRYYNYDYEDMKEMSFSIDRNEKISMTSKIYPTKLEVKIDKNLNRPFLYYEGIVHTNKGMCKIIFPKLDLALDCIAMTSKQENFEDIRNGYRYMPRVRAYKMTTEFSGLDDDNIFYEFRMFGEDDYKDFGDYIKRDMTCMD